MGTTIRRLTAAETGVVLTAAHLFDHEPRREWTARFLSEPGHHLLVAFDDAGTAVGFVSGVEMVHPDKGTEMLVYELGVDEPARRQGIGRALVAALRDIAEAAGCYGMWVGTEPDNAAAIATYRSAGFDDPEPTVTLAVTFDD